MPIKPKSEWSFTSCLEEVDVNRILREAVETLGPDTLVRCLRVTIGTKVYTIANLAWLDTQNQQIVADPDGPLSYIRSDGGQFFLRDGEVRLFTQASRTGSSDRDRGLGPTTQWVVCGRDQVKHILDGVEVRVEVF